MVIPPTTAVAGMETRLKLDRCVVVGNGEVMRVFCEEDNDDENENIAVVVTDASGVDVSEMLAEIVDIVGFRTRKEGKGGKYNGGVPLKE